MTNSVSSNRSKKYNIAAFFSGVGGIELGFEQTNEFRVVYANENAKNLLDSFLRDFFFLLPHNQPSSSAVLAASVRLLAPSLERILVM